MHGHMNVKFFFDCLYYEDSDSQLLRNFINYSQISYQSLEIMSSSTLF